MSEVDNPAFYEAVERIRTAFAEIAKVIDEFVRTWERFGIELYEIKRAQRSARYNRRMSERATRKRRGTR